MEEHTVEYGCLRRIFSPQRVYIKVRGPELEHSQSNVFKKLPFGLCTRSMVACFFGSLCLIEGCFNNAQVMCSLRDIMTT